MVCSCKEEYSNFITEGICAELACTYFQLVDEFGCLAFENSQERACTCPNSKKSMEAKDYSAPIPSKFGPGAWIKQTDIICSEPFDVNDDDCEAFSFSSSGSSDSSSSGSPSSNSPNSPNSPSSPNSPISFSPLSPFTSFSSFTSHTSFFSSFTSFTSLFTTFSNSSDAVELSVSIVLSTICLMLI